MEEPSKDLLVTPSDNVKIKEEDVGEEQSAYEEQEMLLELLGEEEQEESRRDYGAKSSKSGVSLRAEELPLELITPDEAITELQYSHMQSIPERIRKTRTNVYIDELKAQLLGSEVKKKKKKQTSNLMVDKLTLDHLRALRRTFETSVYSEADQTVVGAISKIQMRNEVEKICNAVFPDDEWDLLFIKMDVNGNGYVLYDEFINYLLLEFRIKENLEEDIALWMLEEPVQDLPTFIRSHHRHGVVDITFSPLVKRQRGSGLRQSSFADGKYLTVSEQGTINTWSLNMELENTQECPSPVLCLAKTCVLKAVALSDINLLAVSSTERDLRFYDTTGRHYQLKTRIYKLPFPVTAMLYQFYEDIENDSVFVFGDSEGTINILKFTSKQGGPLKKFERVGKNDYQIITYDSLLRDAHVKRGMSMTVFKNVHSASWVMRISYSNTVWQGKEVIVSCANALVYSLIVIDLTEMKVLKKFKIPRGVNTFCLVEGNDLVVTGGFDTMIRVWHIKAPKKPTSTMSGHYAPLEALYEQHKGLRLFSISRDRVIKVWCTKEMVCIQTCTNKLQELGEANMVCFYNPYYRKVVLAGNTIAYFKLGSEVNKFFSEGFTHVGGVTKALYNSLFKIIVTVGMDSNIMTWNPWAGKLVFVIRKAHTKHVFGENKPMGISAAIFSPSKVYLLTGALDGSIKMWNFTIGTCLRTMNIEEDCVVTGLLWVPGRILAAGWNMHVSEWEDKIEQGDCKPWKILHTKDILILCQCGPKAMVTAAYNGELVFYNLQNGHYYNRFFVGKPNLPITMGFEAAFKKQEDDSSDVKLKGEGNDSVSVYTMSSDSSSDSRGRPAGNQHKIRESLKTVSSVESSSLKKKLGTADRGDSPVSDVLHAEPSCDCEPPCPCEAQDFKGFAGPDKMEVHCLLFLDNRPDHPDVGTLFVALQTGIVQLWSHHPKGGLVDSFYAVHIIGDYITCMATEENNSLLFTGTRFGYVKIWHIENFCVLPEMVVHRSLPRLRLQFPFLWNDTILGRAKRAVRGQPEPFLCSSCRHHLDRIMHIELLSKQKIYVTCGLDRTVRLWTYSGTYIGVLGGVNEWKLIDENEEASVQSNRVPADLTRVISSTSFKVLTSREFCQSIKSYLANSNKPAPPPPHDPCEYKYSEFEEIFQGICDFPEENPDYRLQTCAESETEIIRKNMKEPVLRVLNMLKTVGQYDMNVPKGDRLARNIKQLLEDQDRKWTKGRPTPMNQPTRTRPKERWVERLPSHQRFWRRAKTQDQEAAQSVMPQKSETSAKTGSAAPSSSKTKTGLSQDAKNLEILLKNYEESAKAWYKHLSS